MRTEEAIKYFGSATALGKAVGCSQPSVSNWGEFPPDDRQVQIQVITGGKVILKGGELKADPGALERALKLLTK